MMNFAGQDSTNQVPSIPTGESQKQNYYAFFDKPSADNLAANQLGTLTFQQQEALRSRILSQKTSLIVWHGMLLCALLGMGLLFWLIDTSDGVLSPGDQRWNAAVLILLFTIFALWFRHEWYIFFMGDDLENMTVQMAVGRVEWSGNRYQMLTPDRLLRSMRFHVAMPPPGDYRFYFLPHSGLVVIAEEIEAQVPPVVPELLQILSSANRFTLEDLRSNQSGNLSKGQENRLLKELGVYLLIWGGGTAVLILNWTRILPALSSITNQLILIIVLFVALRVGWSTAALVGDLWNGKVNHVEGPVSKTIRRSRYSQSYYYVNGLHKFQVSRAAYHALLEGQLYRIYYVPISKRLVSIELM